MAVSKRLSPELQAERNVLVSIHMDLMERGNTRSKKFDKACDAIDDFDKKHGIDSEAHWQYQRLLTHGLVQNAKDAPWTVEAIQEQIRFRLGDHLDLENKPMVEELLSLFNDQ